MGCQKVTGFLASSLVGEGHRVTVIGSDTDRLNAIAKEASVKVVLSTGSLMEDLRDIDITTADMCLAVSEDDNWNTMAAQIASLIFHVPDVICLVEDPAREGFYRQQGIRVMCPTTVLTDVIKAALVNKK